MPLVLKITVSFDSHSGRHAVDGSSASSSLTLYARRGSLTDDEEERTICRLIGQEDARKARAIFARRIAACQEVDDSLDRVAVQPSQHFLQSLEYGKFIAPHRRLSLAAILLQKDNCSSKIFFTLQNAKLQ